MAASIALVNAERTANGCPALQVDGRLTEAAQGLASDMVARQFFSHTDPSGGSPSSRAAAAGYPGPMSENIAVGYAGADAVVRGWLASPGHRANILNCASTLVGVGLDTGSAQPGMPNAWVQVFG